MPAESQFELKFEEIKKREATSRNISVIIAIIPFLFGLIWLYYTYSQVKKLKIEENKMQTEISRSQLNLTNINNKYNSIKDSIAQIFKAVKVISADSLSNSSIRDQVILTSIKANDELQNIFRNYHPDSSVRINYYFKSVDDKKILEYLKLLGYRFNPKTPKDAMSSTNTNAIWYGSKVSVNDCKLVALTLIRAGANIKAIRPFKTVASNSHYKENIIEIGGDALLNYENKKPLSVEEISSKTTFNRN